MIFKKEQEEPVFLVYSGGRGAMGDSWCLFKEWVARQVDAAVLMRCCPLLPMRAWLRLNIAQFCREQGRPLTTGCRWATV